MSQNYPYDSVRIKTDTDQKIKPQGPKMPQQNYAADPKKGGYKPAGPERKGD